METRTCDHCRADMPRDRPHDYHHVVAPGATTFDFCRLSCLASWANLRFSQHQAHNTAAFDPSRPPRRCAMSLFQLAVTEELKRAREKFGNMRNAHEAYAVILEELDEFWDEVRAQSDVRAPAMMAKELVQIAAMAQRACEDLDLPLPTSFEVGR